MNKLKSSLLWLWQLPQNLCGIIYRSISKDNRICVIENDDSRSVGAKVYLQIAKGGVTLGKYVFINQDYTDKKAVIKHYIGCCWKNGKYNYYHFYTEKWANKLMGIES